ncbi:hypothetical protein DY000_02038844 [Brassica cretica]|uniref:Uncharacterized protein n=1 Tax=Brassica cretica TaxID=69181 RepID=A0ABQ7B5S8_BRACR|nr:hypothetical protein DY000_02038844 [Brassica cretica]
MSPSFLSSRPSAVTHRHFLVCPLCRHRFLSPSHGCPPAAIPRIIDATLDVVVFHPSRRRRLSHPSPRRWIYYARSDCFVFNDKSDLSLTHFEGFSALSDELCASPSPLCDSLFPSTIDMLSGEYWIRDISQPHMSSLQVADVVKALTLPIRWSRCSLQSRRHHLISINTLSPALGRCNSAGAPHPNRMHSNGRRVDASPKRSAPCGLAPNGLFLFGPFQYEFGLQVFLRSLVQY